MTAGLGTRCGWIPFIQQGSKLVGSGAVGESQQGWGVALSSDGSTALIGGPNDNGHIGAAWVFTRSGGVWSQQGPKLVGSGASGSSYQGSSVALSADGNTALVGGPYDNSSAGATWVFTRSGGSWSQQGEKLVGTGAAGAAVQGFSVALSDDGNTALIGAYADEGALGAAWVFTRSAASWSQQGAKLVGSGAVGAAEQGWSVGLSSDGSTALIGGPHDEGILGAAWVFTRSGATWSQQGAKLVGSGAVGNAAQGHGVALSSDGNTALIGGPLDNGNVGAAWVFTRSAGIWSQQGSRLTGSDAAGTSEQGYNVALSGDGNTALSGGFANSPMGATWVFTRTGESWSQQGPGLVGTGSVGNAGQGFGVALSRNGTTALIGGIYDNSDAGAAWVFTQLPSSPTAPTVSGINPTSGSPTGGTRVTVSGSGFSGATTVSFGSTAAKAFTVNNDTQITAASPPGSGTVDVTVTTPVGTSATGPADRFTYAAEGAGGPQASYVERGISSKLTGALSVSAATSSASPGAQISDYHWVISGPDKPLDFDCGAGSTAMSHPFRQPGSYSLALTVTDSFGLQATTSSQLTVTAAESVPRLRDPYVFDCENPAAGLQPDTKDCVKSFGFGIVDVNSRGRPDDCFQIEARINPGIFVGNARTAQAEQVPPNALRVYDATIGGPVVINGLYVPVPRGVKTEYDSYAAAIGLKGATSVSLQVGPFPTQNIPLSLKVTPDKNGVFHVANVDASANAPKFLGGLPVRGAFSIDLIKHASKVKLGLGLPSIFSFQGSKAAQGDAYLISDNVNGVKFDGIGLLIPEVFVGPLYVTGLSFKYIKSENLWQGGAKITLPGSPIEINAAPPPPDFGFGLKDGRFDHAGFGVEFQPPARPDLFPPFRSVLLTHIGAALGVNPLRLTGTIGLSSGDVVDEDGVLFAAFASSGTPYEFPDNVGEELAPLAGRTLSSFSLAVGGTASLHVPVLGVLPLLHSYGLYEYPDFFEFGGGFSFGISFLQIDGDVKGFVYPSRGTFNAEAGVKACARNLGIGYKFVFVKISPCLNVGAVVSSKGLGFCTILPVPFPVFGVIDVPFGVGYTWGGTPTPMLFSCDYGPYREANPKAAAAAASEVVNLPSGLPAAMIRIRGQDSAPDVTITDPGGHDAAASGDVVTLSGSDGITTLIGLRHPAGGRWTITAKPGSVPIVSVASANALPSVAIKARVQGGHGRRRVLVYRLTPAPGRAVTFAEQGPGTAHIIGAARGRSGRIAFAPAPGRRGRRSIIAIIDQAGGPTRAVTVASYTAPTRSRLGRPGHVRVIRGKRAITLSWTRVPAATRYEVLIILGDGSEVFRVVRGTHVTLPDPFPAKPGTALVDALAADNSRGAASSARVESAARARRHARR
jgi:hypothetical protein